MQEFIKDGYYYRIKSKYVTHKYNITPSDREYIDKKLSYQESFLKSNYVKISDDTKIALFDISMGANIRPDKYLAEISNRVDSFKKYCEESKFSLPIFLTMTPNTVFKPLKVVKTKKKGFYILDDNKKFTGDFDNYVKDCRDDIQKKFRKFLSDRIFKDIRSKYGHRAVHFSSYEPFLDGALHKHSLFFIPPEFQARFIKRFHFYFSDVKRDVKTVFDEDLGGVSAYILKYILKSFRHSETGALTDEGYWYAKHGLSRFSSSRVLLPLYIWRSIRSSDRSYLEMSKEYINGSLTIEIVAKHHSHGLKDFKRSNYNLSSVHHHIYEDNVYQGFETLYTRSRDNYDIVEDDVFDPFPKKINSFKVSSFHFPVVIDGRSFYYDGFNLHKSKIPIDKRSSYDLYQYFRDLDKNIDSVNPQHYHLVRNTLIDRGYIVGSKVSLNDAIIRF